MIKHWGLNVFERQDLKHCLLSGNRDREKTFHTGTVKNTVTIHAPEKQVWRKISNIAGLAGWVSGVKETVYLSEKKRGVGTVRRIIFDDGSAVEEHVVAWEQGRSFTYVATEGLYEVTPCPPCQLFAIMLI